MNADDLPTLREELEAHGLWANKALGQHFLLDLNITSRIARTAGDIAGKPVIEIGPGPGGLTRALLEAGADPLIVIEKDARFLPLLEPLVAWSNGRLRIEHADALAVDEAALTGGARAAIVSNLPYNVGTELLVRWLTPPDW
ncbi:MAG TPA: rRNA adenine N-6-methyltransferase family protein, partial [Terricaulis sp.]|nr:rRNA adenine N-6-methyltransferase family protein [Terricaulis sp.]